MKTIESFAFYGTTVSSVVLPKSLETIENDAFIANFLESIYVKSIIPPSMSGAAFNRWPPIPTIYVPYGTLRDYQEATNWKIWASKMVEWEG